MLVFFFVFFLCTLSQVQISSSSHQCSDSCSESKDYLRSCSCDDDCPTYGTCCVDAKNLHLMSPQAKEYNCYDERVITPVFAKRSCAENYGGHSGHVIMCTETDFHRVDEIKTLLVSSSKTKTTYWNKDCGICNDEDIHDLISWTAQVVCPEKHGNTSINQNLIKENLTFNWKEEDWGLKVGDEFVSCSIIQYQPTETKGQLKYCAPAMVESCPQNYADSEIARLCNAYHGERKLKNESIYFKNEHCALCNGKLLEELDCKERTYSPLRLKGLSNTVKAIFSKEDWDTVLGTGRYKCTNGFDYDPAYGKCRKVPRPNMAVINAVNFYMFLISLVISIKIIF